MQLKPGRQSKIMFKYDPTIEKFNVLRKMRYTNDPNEGQICLPFMPF